ncbi:VOC family protein [Georgenia sp. AZ-5]|uniref:VOC family protein n=1 Tax=Georgenia sp. AZ-5 TaxID=3367526 RepID=UPI00375533C0
MSESPAHGQLHQAELVTSAPAEAAAYYEWLLELPTGSEPGPALRDLGASTVPPRLPELTGWVPVFVVDSVERAVERVHDLGGTHHDLRDGAEERHYVVNRTGAVVRLRSRSGVSTDEPSIYGHANCDYSALSVDDATKFWGRLLDLDYLVMRDDPFEMRFLHGDRRIATGIFKLHGVAGFASRPYWLIYFEVEDVSTSLSRAVESGSRVLIPASASPFNTYAVLTDPWGNRFGFSTLADPQVLSSVEVLGTDGAVSTMDHFVDLYPTPAARPRN